MYRWTSAKLRLNIDIRDIPRDTGREVFLTGRLFVDDCEIAIEEQARISPRIVLFHEEYFCTGRRRRIQRDEGERNSASQKRPT